MISSILVAVFVGRIPPGDLRHGGGVAQESGVSLHQQPAAEPAKAHQVTSGGLSWAKNLGYDGYIGYGHHIIWWIMDFMGISWDIFARIRMMGVSENDEAVGPGPNSQTNSCRPHLFLHNLKKDSSWWYLYGGIILSLFGLKLCFKMD